MRLSPIPRAKETLEFSLRKQIVITPRTVHSEADGTPFVVCRGPISLKFTLVLSELQPVYSCKYMWKQSSEPRRRISVRNNDFSLQQVRRRVWKGLRSSTWRMWTLISTVTWSKTSPRSDNYANQAFGFYSFQIYCMECYLPLCSVCHLRGGGFGPSNDRLVHMLWSPYDFLWDAV